MALLSSRPRRGVAERQRVASAPEDSRPRLEDPGHDPPADGVDVERFEQHREPPGGDRLIRRAALEVDLVLELLQVGRQPDDRLRQRQDGEPGQREAGVVPLESAVRSQQSIGRSIVTK